MSEFPSAELIEEIAVELGVPASFVEKDWYAVQVISLLAAADFGDFEPVFSGGTSLSKGYGLIERFSEDMDFKVRISTAKTRPELRAFRQSVIDKVDGHLLFSISKESVSSADGSKFFSCNVFYHQNQTLDQALRKTGLKLEMRVQDIPMPTEAKEIKSFVNEFSGEAAETVIHCVSPIETAADKFSALLWRIPARDRTAELGTRRNDPTILRHLHDLCALEDVLKSGTGFNKAVNKAFELDKRRGRLDGSLTLDEAVVRLFEVLSEWESAYRNEYDRFVEAMSYAPDHDRVSFDRALFWLNEISNQLIHG